MQTTDVLARALRATVDAIDPDGELVISRRIACVHEAQIELAARLAVELGSESAALAALREAAARVATVEVADYLDGAADLLTDLHKPKAAPASPGTAHPTPTAPGEPS
jgi:hypothetical protein